VGRAGASSVATVFNRFGAQSYQTLWPITQEIVERYLGERFASNIDGQIPD
jgi:hypothetical protein